PPLGEWAKHDSYFCAGPKAEIFAGLSYGTFSIQQIEVDQCVLDRLFQNRASAVTTCVPN
ncbi:MAG: hypothetical protein WCJ35_08685, partial [Planctomycetota bacterium]